MSLKRQPAHGKWPNAKMNFLLFWTTLNRLDLYKYCPQSTRLTPSGTAFVKKYMA